MKSKYILLLVFITSICNYNYSQIKPRLAYDSELYSLKKKRTYNSLREALIKPDSVQKLDMDLSDATNIRLLKDITKLKNLVQLKIWNISRIIPSEIFSLPKLTKLELHQKQINILASSRNSKKVFEQRNNAIRPFLKIPSVINKLTKLKILTLDIILKTG